MLRRKESILFKQLPLKEEDIDSSESRKTHTHSSRLTLALNEHVYRKHGICPLKKQRAADGMSEIHWPKKTGDGQVSYI